MSWENILKRSTTKEEFENFTTPQEFKRYFLERAAYWKSQIRRYERTEYASRAYEGFADKMDAYMGNSSRYHKMDWKSEGMWTTADALIDKHWNWTQDQGLSRHDMPKLRVPEKVSGRKVEEANKKNLKDSVNRTESGGTRLVDTRNTIKEPKDFQETGDIPAKHNLINNIIQYLKKNNKTVSLQTVGEEIRDDGMMTVDEKEAFEFIMRE